MQTIIPNKLYIYKGCINTIILKNSTNAILFNCCDTLTIEKLNKIGIDNVDYIFLTSHKRNHSSGIFNFDAKVVISKNESYLINDVENYWNDYKNRYHIYHFQPSTMILPKSYDNIKKVDDGDIIKWNDYKINIISTPSTTDNAISYKITIDNKKYCISGEMLLKDGKLNEIYSLQKGNDSLDYHGFMGNIRVLIPSLDKISDCDFVLPSYGNIVTEVKKDSSLLKEKLLKLYKSYIKTSAINYFNSDMFNGYKEDVIKVAQIHQLPDFIKQLQGPSYGIYSKTNEVFLIDCGFKEIIVDLKSDENVEKVEYCFITHYHDDHVDMLQELVNEFDTTIITHPIVADVIKNPQCYFLPCVSHNSASVSEIFHGETWQWNEFKLTAFHFPGQTLYHTGLLVEGYGQKIFFAGDSFTPTGFDYYCAQNRNFIDDNNGILKCIDILKKTKPDMIINQHGPTGFSFSDDEYDIIVDNIHETSKLLKEVLVDKYINNGIDDGYIRTYPYEQNIMSGSTVPIQLRFTNHSDEVVKFKALPVLPSGFELDSTKSTLEIVANANSFGECGDYVNSDNFVDVWINTPSDVSGKFILPFRIWKDDKYLGQIRHAIINLI